MVDSKERAEKQLLPIAPALHNCVIMGVNDFRSLDLARQAVYSSTTRAGIIRDSTVAHAKKLPQQFPQVRAVEKGRSFRLVVADELCIVFKKLDSQLRTRYIPTAKALAYHTQADTYPRLPGLDMGLVIPTTNLVVGYQWDELTADAFGVYVTCPAGQTNHWWLAMEAPAASVVQLVPSDAPVIHRRRVALKTTDNQQVEVSTDGGRG